MKENRMLMLLEQNGAKVEVHVSNSLTEVEAKALIAVVVASLMEKGLVSSEDLDDAMEHAVELAEAGPLKRERSRDPMIIHGGAG